MNKKKVSGLSIFLFVLAGLLIAHTGWTGYISYKTIADAIANGQLVFKGSEYIIVNFFVTSMGQTFFFAILFCAVGLMNQKLTPAVPVESKEVVLPVVETMVEETEEVIQA